MEQQEIRKRVLTIVGGLMLALVVLLAAGFVAGYEIAGSKRPAAFGAAGALVGGVLWVGLCWLAGRRYRTNENTKQGPFRFITPLQFAVLIVGALLIALGLGFGVPSLYVAVFVLIWAIADIVIGVQALKRLRSHRHVELTT